MNSNSLSSILVRSSSVLGTEDQCKRQTEISARGRRSVLEMEDQCLGQEIGAWDRRSVLGINAQRSGHFMGSYMNFWPPFCTPKPDADLYMNVDLPLDKKLWKIRTGPPGRWAIAGHGPWAVARWAFGPLGCGGWRVAGCAATCLLLAKPLLEKPQLRFCISPYIVTNVCKKQGHNSRDNWETFAGKI